MCIYVRLFVERKKKAAFRENMQWGGKRKIQKED